MPIKRATLGSLLFIRRLNHRTGNEEINSAFIFMGENFTLRGNFLLPYGSGIRFFDERGSIDAGYLPGEDVVPTQSRCQIGGVDFDALVDGRFVEIHGLPSIGVNVAFTISSHNLTIPNDATAPVINLTTSFSLNGRITIIGREYSPINIVLIGGGFTIVQLLRILVRDEITDENTYVYKPCSLLYTIDDRASYRSDLFGNVSGFGRMPMPVPEGEGN